MTLALLAPLSASASVSLGEANLNALSSGLVAYWSMNGNTINWTTGTIQDLSGQGNTGYLLSMSTTTSPAVGKIGQALQFNGSTQSVTVPNSSSLKPSLPVTISAWVKLSGPPNYSLIFASDALNATYYGYEMDVTNSNTVEINYGDAGAAGASSRRTKTSVGTVGTGTWHLVTGVIRGPTDMSIYIDGVDAGGSYSGTGGSLVYSSNAGTIAGGNIWGGSAFFGGAIDDVRVYSRALSAQEVQMLYETGTFDLGVTPAINSSFSIDQGGLNGGLVVYWPLDGNTTNWATGVTNDVSGNAANANLTGFSTTTSPVPGKIGQALAFNGSTSYITTGYTIPVQSSATSFTWSTWMKLNASGGTIVIMGFRNGATWVKLTPSAFEYSAGSIISHTIPTGQWVLITIVKNGTNFTYYQNGAVIGTASNSSSVVSHVMYLGEDPGFGGDGILNGDLDDVRVYNRALSQQEVQQLYDVGQVNIGHSNTNSTTGLNSGLVGYWTFDGPTINWASGVVSDTSGNGNNGQLVGMSTTSSPVIGKTGQALNFNGSNQNITLPNISPSIGNNITVSLWVKANGSSFAQDTGLVTQQWLSGTALKFAVVGDADTGGSATTVGAGFFVSSTWHTVNESGSFPFGKWTLVTATYDGSTLRLYINGVQNNTTSVSGTLTDDGMGWYIGRRWDTGTYFNGTLDNVRIYSRALSPQEIAQLYASGQ